MSNECSDSGMQDLTFPLNSKWIILAVESALLSEEEDSFYISADSFKVHLVRKQNFL